MGEHTPGPWIVFVHRGTDTIYEVLPAMRDGMIAGSIYKSADASLIAAAPTTLDALNAAQYYIGQLEAAQRGIPVRDLDEAQSAFIAANTKARTALNHD